MIAQTAPSTTRVALSVIVPTYNRSKVLQQCLRALASQTLPPQRYEVIVGDDGSTDDTATVVVDEAKNSPMPIRYFYLRNSGPGAARNRGLDLSTAHIALIINDDTIAAPDLLAEHLSAHSEYGAEEVAILGRVTISPEVAPSIFVPLHLDAAFNSFAGRTELDWRAFITSNISVKRSFLAKYGVFQEGMFPHEDLELGERLNRHGLRIVYRPSALGYHLHHLTEADYLRAAERDGRALAQWYKKAPELEPILASLGLYGHAPLRKSLTHRLADSALAGPGKRTALATARLLGKLSDSAALFAYKKVYQYVRRAAIDAEMRRPDRPVPQL